MHRLLGVLVIAAWSALPVRADQVQSHTSAGSTPSPLPTPTAVPRPKPIAVCGSGARTGCGGPPPCNYQEQPPVSHPAAPRFYPTRQGVHIRLQPIPTTPPVTALSLYGDTIAWGVPSYSDPRAHFSHPPRLYLATLTNFHPILISQDNACGTGFDDMRLSANWLVWMQHVPTYAGKGVQLNRIWVLNLHTWHRFLVNFRSNPAQGVVDLDPLSLDGDTVVWARTTIYDQHRWANLTILSRRLTDWRFSNFGIQTYLRLRNGRFDFPAPHLEGYRDPQIAGRLLTYVRERWNGTASVSDVMLKDLTTGQVRELWRYNGVNPTTNGMIVAWEVQPGDQAGFTLTRYDPRSGNQIALSTNVDTVSYNAPGPRLSSSVLAWRTRDVGKGGRNTYRIVARDLHTGREYGLANGSDFYAGTGIAFTILTGPGWGWGNRAVWQQTFYDRRGRGRSYLVVGDVP